MAGSRSPFTNPLLKGFDERLPILRAVHYSMTKHAYPKNLNYWWNFGSLAGIVLVIMIVSGITLAMHYAASTEIAFNSVERIMRDVNSGWLIRYIHMNGASVFFIVVYI
ncbi:MAG: cytochrome b, partial [Marivivens sp.]|nr:cytochrome b [Marivivens sp.]